MGDPQTMDAAEWDRTVEEASLAAAKRWRIVGRDPEDLRNEIVVRLMRYRDKPVSRAALFGLALAIGRNLAVDIARATAASPIDKTINPESRAAPRSEPVGGDADRAALLETLVRSLTPEERLIVRLCIVDGRPLREAAVAAGLPVATLRRRLQAAVDTMDRVREAWNGETRRGT